ncbi:MAG: MBL fold metallo-hydrolase [Gemmatimonadota bacterium]
MDDLLEGVTWFKGSSVRIRRDGFELHVDPIGVSGDSTATHILLTHPHYDNFSEVDIARLRGPETLVIAPATMKKLLDGVDHFMRPGDLLQLDELDVLAVPAHNVEKRFHRPEQGWLGYVFTLAGVTYYHAGDTDFLPSMFGIRCDVAFLPCGGHYTMDADDAARAGEACGASIVVPIHWGDAHGTLEDVRRLAAHFSGEVRILEREG